MDTPQLDAYCGRNGITPKARLVINQVRASPPTRRVQSGTHNVACRFSSRKMGLVIQAESHKNELPAVIGWEHDDQTYEFYDQPPKVKLRYIRPNGTRACYLATPDFFLLQEGFAGWVECKTEEWLQARAAEGSTLYVRDGANGWRCPAGEEYAASVDLGFQVRSSSATQWKTIRNLEFLADYLDERCPAPSPEVMEHIRDAMGGQAWIVLKELLSALPGDADALYKMIADGALYARLDEELLTEPECIHVHGCRRCHQLRRLRRQQRDPAGPPIPRLSGAGPDPGRRSSGRPGSTRTCPEGRALPRSRNRTSR